MFPKYVIHPWLCAATLCLHSHKVHFSCWAFTEAYSPALLHAACSSEKLGQQTELEDWQLNETTHARRLCGRRKH